MNRFFVSALIAIGMIASAQAADMPKKMYTKAPVMAVPPSWTGWYAGVNAGYGFGSESNTFNFVPAVAAVFDNVGYSDKLNGFIGGGQIGYNYQITPNSWVAGVEADIQYTNFKGSDSNSGIASANLRVTQPFAYSQDQSLNWLGTFRGRLGWTPTDHTWLFYATGGLAVGGVKASNNFTYGTPPPDVWTGSASATKAGWTLGGGVEARLPDMWSVKAEYLYYDLGHLTVNGTSVQVPAFTTTTNFAFHGNIVRLGLNKHF